ncbi:MAG: histidine kinase [Saprospiraceae bacterium]|nr:histidine kinase [Saprospiraceae bacterium]
MRLLIFICLLSSQVIFGQKDYHFSKLTVADGLSDGYIQAIGQDKYGYMWFATLGDLCRFDGKRMTHFRHRDNDSTSLLSGYPQTIVSDSAGRLFIGFSNGLAEFDFKTRTFHAIKGLTGHWVWSIVPLSKDLVFVATAEGLARFNPTTSEVVFLKNDNLNLEFRFGYWHKDKLYLAHRKGLVVYDLQTDKARKMLFPTIPDADFRQIAIDDNDHIWVAAKGTYRILRLSLDGSEVKSYDQFLVKKDLSVSTNQIVKDKKGRIWIAIKYNGLLQYDPQKDVFVSHLHDSEKSWSLSSDQQYSLFCSRKGLVWCGGDNVNFFHPDQSFFNTILPFDTDLEIKRKGLSPALAPKGSNSHPITTDKSQNLWLGTREGLVMYDPKNQNRRVWRNQNGKISLWDHNICDIACDKENNVWIGTSKGLNRYNRRTGQMEFWDMKDSCPKELYMMIYTDKLGNVWLSPRISPIRYYSYSDKKVHTLAEHPALSALQNYSVWTMIQDSKGRYWFVLDDVGLMMYDPSTQKTEKWQENTEGGNLPFGNSIVDIKEDKNGIIWLASYSGLTSFDYTSKVFKSYRHENLMGTPFSLEVDQFNRLWVGTGRGLVMVDSSRTLFTPFGISDGLPSLEFMKTFYHSQSDGWIRMSTRNGFVIFNPNDYATQKWFLDFYVTSFSSNKVNEQPILEDNGHLNIQVSLDADENFFQFNLTAINFLTPSQTWFAYKLEGVDKDWRYTQDPKAVYTNVSGGDYIFRYKATANLNDWEVPEKTIKVHINTIFYKSWWFWSLILASIGFMLYRFYQFREQQRQQVFNLSSRAQSLEREKAIMQYEGLKQQLNPHFLFNSLTSLGSLITIDPSVAMRFLENLSKTYRYILKSSESETVPLRDEIKFAEAFAALQKVRFEKGFDVVFDVLEGDLDKRIAPVTLQNMIENAIKHNIIDDESPLIVQIYSEGDYLVVKNNLQKKRFVETSNKHGLTNLTSLYTYLSNKPLVTTETNEWFIVKIPFVVA